ncbi:hypothetical protein ETU08_08795 [Apibacter muscae]|uniref:PIN domain-containing protein n=1 Tax=Apibacter muscae TaxID=2509004 RepID=A0A563DBM3_9FLAO|nr:hypothetical protein [Apibacter muscae]TWP27311.1 hypothetical protein ETU09_07650 [Apibacter muscae]TWP28532.1 hypothetical protein ETU08_08795 [Apibacter muscae]
MNSNIFRLAAILYADNNYEVSTKTINRKIIESVFLDNNNEIHPIHKLIEVIQDKYEFIFMVDEIREIVSCNEYFIISPCKTNELNISLTLNRFEFLKKKVSSNNIDYFISQFHQINKVEQLNINDLKQIIYRFLYEVFQTNITSFSKLINPNIKIEDIININNLEFNQIEIDIINSFLNWENDEKNKVVFDISSLALEYCLISNKKGNNFKLENLRNKIFYLDTNIIFRAIGINGENRQKQTITFLEKFKDADEHLYISTFTIEELKSTINYYVKSLNKVNSIKINSDIFMQYSKNSDFLLYFHKWKKNRSNANLDLFQSHILSEIEMLKNKYCIQTNYKTHFDFKDEKIQELILDKASQINTYKSQKKDWSNYYESSIFDAKNIYLIDTLRKGLYVNIFDCKYFMISSDQYLRRWDYISNKSTPIVLLPSQWMSILLRYLNRTNDDFKSFVSFLNIHNSEKQISNENLQLILQGISEITSDFSQQNSIISEMINIKFNGILKKSFNEEQIIENSKTFAKTKLEQDLEAIQKELKRNIKKFERYQENTSNAIDNLKQQKDNEKLEKDKTEEENNKIKQELLNLKVKDGLRKYKLRAYWAFFILVMCLFYIYFSFFFTDKNWNIISIYKNHVNKLNDGSIEKDINKYIFLIPLTIIMFLIKFIYNRLFNKEKIEERKQKLIERYTK